MSTHLPFVRQRESTVRRPVSSRPPAPPRPTLGHTPLEQQPVTDPTLDATSPAAMAQPTVVQNVTTAPAGVSSTGTAAGYVAPDAVITSVIGGLMLAIGLVTIARLGLGGSVLQPVEEILGVPHTPLLGLVEIGLGLAFVVLGVLAARSASIVLGAVLAVAGAIVVVAIDDFDADLALTRDVGWAAIVAGGVIVLVNVLLPAIAVRSNETTTFST